MTTLQRGQAKQPTLFNLRFGMERSTRSSLRRGREDGSGEGQDGTSKDAKRARRHEDPSSDPIVLSDDENEDGAAPSQDAKGTEEGMTSYTGIGTTTNPAELRPVTRQDFLQTYAVKGMEDVYYQRTWLPVSTAHRWRRELDTLLEWYRPKLRVYGREIQQSRAIAAFSTAPGLDLKYSGHQVDMHSPFPPLLEEIAARLAQNNCLGTDVKFNHAMLNRYDDGSVYIGKHSDNIENKVIVTVSLGAPRSWIMEEKRPRKSSKAADDQDPPKRHRWILENGSLLVMQGQVQQRYTHEIPKELKVKEPRISITFRQLVY